MSVLVDSPVWSLAFRRKTVTAPQAHLLSELIQQKRAFIIGPVRQEVLSGVRERARFESLRDRLRAFPDHPVTSEHFERAAEFHNTCRLRGVQGSHIDFLICAVSELDHMEVFTTDLDFNRYASVLPIRLFSP